MIIRLSKCNGQMHHAKVSGSESCCKTAYQVDFCLLISVKWERKPKLVMIYTNTTDMSDVIRVIERVVSAQSVSVCMTTVMRYLRTGLTA